MLPSEQNSDEVLTRFYSVTEESSRQIMIDRNLQYRWLDGPLEQSQQLQFDRWQEQMSAELLDDTRIKGCNAVVDGTLRCREEDTTCHDENRRPQWFQNVEEKTIALSPLEEDQASTAREGAHCHHWREKNIGSTEWWRPTSVFAVPLTASYTWTATEDESSFQQQWSALNIYGRNVDDKVPIMYRHDHVISPFSMIRVTLQ